MRQKFFVGRLVATVLVAVALVVAAASPIASAAHTSSYVNYAVTSVSNQNGRAVLYGYFYNNGNSGGTVTEVNFLGYIGDVPIDAAVTGISLYVSAGGSVDYTITITDGRISSRTSENAKLSTNTVFH